MFDGFEEVNERIIARAYFFNCLMHLDVRRAHPKKLIKAYAEQDSKGCRYCLRMGE